MTKLKKTALAAAASLLLLPGSTWLASERLENATNMNPHIEETTTSETSSETPRFTCNNCNQNEKTTLAFLQTRAGIKDKFALATIMGNIKQESRFHPNICEGGARTSYGGCHRGGFGLIQWTTSSRYYGLGHHARVKGLNPSTLPAQLSWMLKETQWRSVEHKFKTPGQSVGYYMNAAYRWLGWGIHGARTHYAYDYASRFTLMSQ